MYSPIQDNDAQPRGAADHRRVRLHAWRYGGTHVRLLLIAMLTWHLGLGLGRSTTASAASVCNSSSNPTLLSFGSAIANTYAGSGFGCYLPGTIAPTAGETGLTLDPAKNQLIVASANGDIFGSANAQENALAIKLANSGSYAVRARIVGPLSLTSSYQAAGVFLGLDANNYAKLVVGRNGSLTRLQFGTEKDAAFSSAPDTRFDLSTLDSPAEGLDLWLVRKNDGGIEALYRTITNVTSNPTYGNITSVGAVPASTWSAGNSPLYSGILTTDTGTGGSFNTSFDEFELGSAPISSTNNTSPNDSISFGSKVLVRAGASANGALGITDFNNPTSIERGPDGKLYVATQFGKIYILTLDNAKLAQPDQIAVTNVQVLNDIYDKPTRTCNINNDLNKCQYLAGSPKGRLVTGIVIGPESTPTSITLYVSHADPRYGKNNSSSAFSMDTRSAAISRLKLQPNAATSNLNDYTVSENQDLVVGLPRSRENHSVNGLDFGPDGWLYFSVAGNTNFGKPSAFFSSLEEYYLSAAVLRLNVNALAGATLPLNVEGVTSAAKLAPLAGKFEMYATGFRNGYDLQWHSNGKLYMNVNGGNNGLGNTPDAADGCANTASINPGMYLDGLFSVTAGMFGGHPNPARGECVLADGKDYSPAKAANPKYIPPIFEYAQGNSTNGLVEYTANTFGGKLKGNLISSTYAGNQNVRRVILSPDGQSVIQEESLGQFDRPLDVSTDASGIIYVAEHGADQIRLLIPNEAVNCPDSNKIDDDSDGYTDQDELGNGTDPCSAANLPADADGDKIGDTTDPDDDNDGLMDGTDQLFFSAQNGAGTALPLAFEWNPGDAPLSMVANSGFPGTQIASQGVRTDDLNLSVGAAGGFMAMATSSGTALNTTNNQVNAVQLGFDSTADFRISTRLVEPFNSVQPAAGHAGGIFFGPSEDNYVRLALLGGSGGAQTLQLGVEQGGAYRAVASASLGTARIENLDLYLVGDYSAKTVTAFYDLDENGRPKALGTPTAIPVAWFSDNIGSNRNTSLAGIMVTDGSAESTTFVFDFFHLDRNVDFALAAPTSLVAAGSGGQVQLLWNEVTGNNGYYVYRSTSSQVELTAANRINGGKPISSTSFTDTNVQRGRQYYYVVTGIGGASGESPPSNVATARVFLPPLYLPIIPANR